MGYFLLIPFMALVLFFIFFFIYKSKNSVNNTSKSTDILLYVGMSFIILSTVISVGSSVKSLALLIETLVFLLMGLILKKDNNKQVSNTFITISLVTFFATMISAFYQKIFGTYLSFFGSGRYLCVMIISFVQLMLILMWQNIINHTNYFLSFLLMLIFMFAGVMNFSNNVIASSSITALMFLLINIFVPKSLKDATWFKILNITLTFVFSILFAWSCTYFFMVKSMVGETRIFLLIFLASLFANSFISTYKDSDLSILSIIYGAILTIIFCIFSRWLLASAVLFAVSSMISYAIYYVSKTKGLSLASVIVSYIEALIAVIIFLASRKYAYFGVVVSIIYYVLTITGSLKDKEKKFNIVMQPIFLLLSFVAVITLPSIIHVFKFQDIMLLINAMMFIAFLSASMAKRNIKNVYFICLLVTVFITSFSVINLNLWYVMTPVITSLLITIYAFLGKDKFINKAKIAASVLLVLNTLIALNGRYLLCIILTLAFLVLLSYFNKDNKLKYLYLSLLYIPLALLIYHYLPFDSSLKKNINYVIAPLFIFLFSRNIIDGKDQAGNYIVEFILYSIIASSITNPVYLIILGAVIFAITYILSLTDKKSAKVYLTYLMFLIPFMFCISCGMGNGIIPLIFLICLMLLDALFYLFIEKERPLWQEIVHLCLIVLMMAKLVDGLSFMYFYKAIFFALLITILYFLYTNKKAKDLCLATFIFPLFIVCDNLPNNEISNVLTTLIFIFPVTILSRKILKIEQKASNISEFIIILLLFTPFIFDKLSITSAITVCVSCFIMLILGFVLKYKSYIYGSVIAIASLLIIQTFFLWHQEISWLGFLILGIIFITLAIIKESKKK